MFEWQEGVTPKAICEYYPAIEEKPGYIFDEASRVANYLRYRLDIDRTKMHIEGKPAGFGTDEVLVLMKNPSKGIGEHSDRTLRNLTCYMPPQFGVIHCVNITPVVAPFEKDLSKSDNRHRLQNAQIQANNREHILSLLDQAKSPIVVLATGNLQGKEELSNLYDRLYPDLSAYDVRVINETSEKNRITGCHPGYTVPKPKRENVGHRPYLKDGYYDLHRPMAKA